MHYKLFEWCIVPFELMNALGVFTHVMNQLFEDLLDQRLAVFLDNILILGTIA